MTDSDARVETSGLSRWYRVGFLLRRREALVSIDLELAAGERLALLGMNGSGKSSLLRLIAGLEPPSSGSLRVLGGSPGAPSVRRRIGFVPDGSPFPSQLPLEAMLVTVGRLNGLGARAARDRALEALEQAELLGARRLSLSRCSLGMRRRFALAQAFLVERDLYLLDEPGAGLDAPGQGLLDQLLDGAQARGASLILASHQGAEWARQCERVLLLDAGRPRWSGSTLSLLASAPSIEVELEGEQAFEKARGLAEAAGLRLGQARPSTAALLDWYRAHALGAERPQDSR